MNTVRPCDRACSRGLTLVEALIAVLVLAFGLLVVARLQPQLRQQAEVARQRSEAVRIAQQEIERLRAFAVTETTPGLPAFADIADAERLVEPDEAGSNTRYRLVRRVDPAALPHARPIDVTVEWTDRSGTLQSVQLASVIAAGDPALSGAATLAPRGVDVRGVGARSIQIPLAAKDLGDGRSVLKPTASATEAWVFDNRSGAVAQRCTGIAAAVATRDLSTTDLSACTRVSGMTVSGEVHFSDTAPPAADAPNDAPLSLSIALAVEGGAMPVAPWCDAEATTTASERFVGYRCVVVPPVGVRTWSGRTTVVPSGWVIGTGPADRRVCRYTSDQDGSGAIDSNAEHPAIYQNVDRALARQNFLVIQGSQTCPTPSDGRTEARLATVQHQPEP